MKGQLKKQDFLTLFMKEAEGHILELNKGLLELENDPGNRAVLEEVRRRAHTLKGSAKMMGFIEVSNAAHAMEDLLESVRMDMSELDKSVFDKLLQSVDSINVLLQQASPKTEEDEQAAKASEVEASAMGKISHTPEAVDRDSSRPPSREEMGTRRKGEVAKEQRGESPRPRVSASRVPVTQDAILVKTDKLDSLAGVVGEMVLDQVKSENQTFEISQMANLMREQFTLWSQIKEKISTSRDIMGKIPHTPGEHASTAPSFSSQSATRHLIPSFSSQSATRHLRIEDMNRYDNLSTSILDDMINLLDGYRQITSHRRLVIDRLLDDIRSIRLVPVSVVFDTFPRAVRDLGREYGKDIKLEISGGDVELDKSIIETIKDPLMHLVRNAVDHGIEDPEERLRRRKSKTGNIGLSAYHRGSKVVIEISDDGAGIDLDKVKQIALKKGYIKESQLETIDDESATQLIFLSGLSTSSMITDVSGRGVGMDVVMEAVSRNLKGMVDVHTEIGVGTKIALVVPITLAIMRGLLVRVGQETFAIPTESIEKSDKLTRDQVRSVEGKQVVVDGERIIPLVQLSAVLGLSSDLGSPSARNSEMDGSLSSLAPSLPRSPAFPNAESATRHLPTDNGDTIPIVIIEHAQKQIGFCVDSFVGEQEMVIKNLGSFLNRVPDVAGVTILGSGEVVPILHISELINSAENKVSAASYTGVGTDQQKDTPEAQAKPPSILIVDDSITTRELERGILETSGYNVDVAVDGLDGLSKVSEKNFDLIISDVQMPRMDGFQMVEKLKQSEYKDIPVIMVTALKKDEEKRRGIEVGASAYIVKSSFDQTTLLDTIQMLIS